MKVHHTKYKPRYEAYILDHIDVDYENQPLTTKEQKIEFLAKRFNREKKIDIEQTGIRPALIDWLQGLAIPFACYYGEIIDLAIEFGSIDENPSDKLCERVFENYFSFMANIILNMEGFNDV